MRWEYWREIVLKAERLVCLKIVKLITFVHVLPEWHHCALCSVKNEVLFCCASHWLLRDIPGWQVLVWSYFSFLQRKPMPFQQIEKKKEKESSFFFLLLLLVMTRLFQDGSTGTIRRSGHCLQSLTSLCQFGIWPCVFKPTSALSTFSLAINSAELWPISLFALIFPDTSSLWPLLEELVAACLLESRLFPSHQVRNKVKIQLLPTDRFKTIAFGGDQTNLLWALYWREVWGVGWEWVFTPSAQSRQPALMTDWGK